MSGETYENPLDDPDYQKFVEELAEKCTCTPCGARPCDGLLAGGLCDDMHPDDDWHDQDDQDDFWDDCEPADAQAGKEGV